METRRALVYVVSVWTLTMVLGGTSVFALPELRLEWEYDVTSVAERGFSWSVPIAADLDGDGIQEIIVGTEKEGRMVAVKVPGQLMWIFPPLDEDPTARMNKVHSADDIDGDGKVEVIYSTGDPPGGALYILNGDDGTVKYNWSSPEANFKYGGTIIRDLDGDGVKDILATGADSKVYVFSNTAEYQWEKFLPPGRSIDSYPNAFDIDKDGLVEIVVFAREGSAEGENGRVYCLSPTGQEKWSWSSTKVDQLHIQPVFADVNDDGDYEVVVGVWDFDVDSQGGLVILNWWGNELYRKHTPHRIGSNPMVWDIDEDGSMEIIVIGKDQPALIYCLAGDLSEKWVYNFTDIHNGSNPSNMGGALGDVTGDGKVDIVYQTRQDSRILVLDGNGQLAAEPYLVGGESTNAVIIGDIDNDGKSEIIAVAGTKIACLTMDAPYDASLFPWPMAGKDTVSSGMLPIHEALFAALPMLVILLIRKR